MTPLAQFVVAGVGTYLIRASAIAIVGRRAGPRVDADPTLRLIAPSVLAAVVAAQLFLADGELAARWDWCVAAAVAAAVSLRWRSAGPVMLSGLATVWLLAPVT